MQVWHHALDGGGAVDARATGRAAGDLAIDGPPDVLGQRRRAIVDRPWVWLRQVHGDRVVVVGDHDDPAALAGTEADALVTARTDVALAVHGADCGIVGLWSPEGVIGAVHAGWRGLEVGVVASVVDSMRSRGAGPITAVAGPCIGPECYEFGASDLDRVAAAVGPEVRGTTSSGTPALDLPAALAVELTRAGVTLQAPAGPCTACAADEHWSFRARGEHARQALVIWRTAPGGDAAAATGRA